MTLTYAELDAWANRIARGIRDRCGEGEGGVALLFDHDAVVISAMLGALKAGTYYVALDPAYPRPRLEQTLQDSEVGLVLTDCRNLELARTLAGPLQVVDEAPATADQALPSRSGPGDDFALLLYTSGSTGAPKGIVQSHRNVLHDTMHYTNRGRLTHEDRFLLISSVSFAASVRTIYTALLNGASLHPFDVNTEGFPRLAQWMREQAITIYRSVPTVFRYFASTLTGDDQFPALRLLYLGGEPVSRTDVAATLRRHPAGACW
jgi:non-ribosomal peptide synthetase component F